ncbi:MAG: TatD family hydrolase [Puniceicoccales bacterium]|jgi:TatD DNase family protein|nr:TatD family hydrolase [Puniceicoccales bacterium]
MDSHVHLDYFPEEQRDAVIRRAWDVGLRALLTVAVSLERVRTLRGLAEQFPSKVFYSVGLHPTELGDTSLEIFLENLHRELSVSGLRPVAVGETGLDYAALPKEVSLAREMVARQKKFFQAQAEAAKSAHLPLIIHCRDVEGKMLAWNDVNEILNAVKIPKEKILIHCFSYGPEELRDWQKSGGWVSFSGLLTRARASWVHEALCRADLSHVLFETDAPFLLPEPLRSKNPKMENEPANVIHVFNFAAKLLGKTALEVAELSLCNGCTLFKLEVTA